MNAAKLPTDSEVCKVLSNMITPTSRELVAKLVDSDFDERDAQRAVHRCLDRGLIKVGQNLRFTLSETGQKELT